MYKKLLSIALGIMLAFATIMPTSAMADCIDDGIKAKYFNLGMYNEFRNFDKKCTKKNANTTILVDEGKLLSDGLSASGLIGATNANLALTASLPDTKIHRGRIVGKKIYIIGGTDVIDKNIENKLKNEGYNVKRLSGKNRYETSYRVAEEIKRIIGKVNSVALVNGKNGEADAVSIASAAIKNKMPVIVTDGKKLDSSLSSVKTYAIGGKSVISESLVKKTKATRLGGKDRYETNKKVIQKFYPGCKRFTILDEYLPESFSVLAITENRPIVLANAKSDKSLLNGAKEIEFVYIIALHPNIESSCLAGAAGKGVYKAYETLYKKLGNSRNNISYSYNPKNNYVDKSSLRKNYYIFNQTYFYHEGDNLEYEYEDADCNYLVNKKTMKIYTYSSDHVLRFVK